ncbi:toprim domain-containing protein [bacterium]|nr:toprim domain-containing protein [bacterium]
MSTMMDDTLKRVKTEIDLISLVKEQGIELKKKGKNLVGLCPFHDDKDPSLIITPSKNLWHCMGACGMGGGVIDWTMKTQSVEFKEAVKILSERLNEKPIIASFTTPKSKLPSQLSASKETPAIPKDQKLLKRVLEYYHEQLKQTPAALDYLTQRGLIHPDLIEKFQLGYCDRSLNRIIPDSSSHEGKTIRNRLREAGIYRQTGGHELFNGCLTIPIKDCDGNILEIYGRRIKEDTRLSSHLYLPGPHLGVFNPEGFRDKELILCESIIDALSFWVHGFENVTAIYGTEGFTQTHEELIKSQGIRDIILAFDNDPAGENATLKIGKKLHELGLDVLKINLPKGLDINEVMLLQKEFEQQKITLSALLKQVEVVKFIAESPPTKTAKEEIERLPTSVSSLAANIKPESIPTPKVSKTSGLSVKLPEIGGDANAVIQETEMIQPDTKHPPDGVLTIKGEEIFSHFGKRQYRIRGLFKNLSLEVLRINLKVVFNEHYYLDHLDLYHAKSRLHFIQHACEELGVKEAILKSDLGHILLKLEEIQVDAMEKTLKPDKPKITLSAEQEQEAIAFLRSQDLIEKISEHFRTCGMVGEKANCLTGYLAATSRKLDKPLAVMIQSSSSAGKSTLMDAILQFIPDEEQLRFTAITGQSLFYMGEEDLVHKTLAISEGEGADKATYALKTLQSEGKLKIASTSKDPKTGRLETQSYDVKGPTQLFGTTTMEIDEELQNRFFIITVDESENQTKAIQEAQRKDQSFLGLIAQKNRHQLITLHQNAQRLLKLVPVINPYAKHLTFPSHRLRMRRDNLKYLTLIRTITLLYQYQREKKESFDGMKTLGHIESTVDDIMLASELCEEIFKRSLDELTPQTRRLLTIITEMVESIAEKESIPPLELRFTRKTLREYSGFSDFQVRTHLRRLVELEYLFCEQGLQGQRFVYGQLYSAKEENQKPVFMGLIDRKTLEKKIKDENEKFKFTKN